MSNKKLIYAIVKINERLKKEIKEFSSSGGNLLKLLKRKEKEEDNDTEKNIGGAIYLIKEEMLKKQNELKIINELFTQIELSKEYEDLLAEVNRKKYKTVEQSDFLEKEKLAFLKELDKTEQERIKNVILKMITEEDEFKEQFERDFAKKEEGGEENIIDKGVIIFGNPNEKPDIIITDLLKTKIEVVNQNSFFIKKIDNMKDTYSISDFMADFSNGKTYNQMMEIFKKGAVDLEKKMLNIINETFPYDKFPNFPMPLTQVWAYHDPKNIGERIGKNFEELRRVDIIFLYKGRKIIIEVDGIDHIARGETHVVVDNEGNAVEKRLMVAKTEISARTNYKKNRLIADGYEVYTFNYYDINMDNTNIIILLRKIFNEILPKTE